MSDDDFSGLIRSGKSHSVSVSEHTGNAKITRNKVSSDEQEIAARKAAFEKQLAQDKANIQKASLDSTQAKGQSVSTDKSNINRQEINQGLEVANNVEGIKTERLKDNNQKIDSSTTASNLQKAGNANITSNNQGVAKNKAIQDNDQKIPNVGISKNNQVVNGEAFKSNGEVVGKGIISDNNQVVESKKIAANDQKVPNGKGISTNVQGISVDGVVTNEQSIDQPSLSPNNPSLSKEPVAPNKQATQSVVNDKNLQSVLNGAPITNDAKTPKLALEDNNQVVAEQALDKKRQPLENLDPSLNMNRAPKEGAIGANRQPTDKENLDNHFEVLPSETIKRAEVDFELSVSDSNSELPDTFSKIKQQVSAPVTERPLTAQQAAKLKHDMYLEVFHGRLAGIKRGVDALNGRLDVMEKRK